MKTNNLNIIVLPDSSIYLNDERVKWIYENLYGQYGRDFKVKIEDGRVVVFGSIMIPYQYDSLEVKIDEVYGNVVIDNYDNHIQGNLTTLENFPTIIHGDFKCKWQPNLLSLKGGPKQVDGDFKCKWQPNLLSLKGGPKQVDGDFMCIACGLTSLEYLPEKIGRNLVVYSNKIENLSPILESKITGLIDIEYNPCEKSQEYINMLKTKKYKFIRNSFQSFFLCE